MDDFKSIWNQLQANLTPGRKIKIWNPYNGYLAEDLTIKKTEPQFISIDPPRVWDTQVIPRDDFEQVWRVWGEYTDLHLDQRQMRSLSEHHKYITSILRWLETEAMPATGEDIL